MSSALWPGIVGLSLIGLFASACVDVVAVDGLRYVDREESGSRSRESRS
jgi:hypothetical protein